MKHTYAKVLISSIAMAVASASWAAGAHDGGHHGEAKTSQGNGHGKEMGKPMVGQPGKAKNVDRTVAITMMDNYFEPKSVSVKPGETIRFTVKNEGALVHEFNIATAAMHEAHQEEMQMMVEHGVLKGDRIDKEAMNMDMGNGQTMSHDHANSVLLEPGQSGEIIWKFSKPGELEFACNVPGHYQAGMYGDIEFK
jgi:uncharacterized cupredoxin-like copper-binding protein